MTKSAEKVLAQAMTLDRDERLALAETLLESAAISSDPQYVASWKAEIDRRISEYERGDVKGVPWEAVRSRLADNTSSGNA